MAREQLRDGAGLLATYVWDINHTAEQAQVNSINLTRTALTTGVGYVRQQGSPAPSEHHWTGTILTQAQYDAMLAYYRACAGIGTPPRTVFLTDYVGVENEILIVGFSPTRTATARNPRGVGLMGRLTYWTYDFAFEVIA